MKFDKKDLGNEELLNIWENLILPRRIEERMLILLRQGKISKWFSGIGQEAVAVGSTLALAENDYILPMHRNLGVFTSRKVPFQKLFAQWQGKKEGFSKGRERSFHFGSNEHHIVGMISQLAAMTGVANGIALNSLLEDKKECILSFTGDGATSEGDFHEALNVAAVWNLPVIFLVENNGYGLSTPSNEQFKCKSMADKGIGYGMKSLSIDGNNVLEVYSIIKKLSDDIRDNPEPVLLECRTFRMRGHEEASGIKYVPKDLIEEWAEKDPIDNFTKYLKSEKILTKEYELKIEEEINSLIIKAILNVEKTPDIVADIQEELGDVFVDFDNEIIQPESNIKEEMRLIDAISKGLEQSLEKHDDLIFMGQDVAEYGGVFKVSEDFYKKFGKDRIRNTPITESSIIGASLGLSIAGRKSVVEIQFSDFVACGFNQIVNNLAKSNYRWGQKADVVLRMPCGAGVGAGPFHSQTHEGWFSSVPGLKIVYPSSPSDAKALLCQSINDPNPVIFFEHKYLYRSIKEDVLVDYHTIELGKGKKVRSGNALSIITYGWGVKKALEEVERLNIDAEIIDLRTLLPWDKDIVEETVKNTGKVLVLQEATESFGIASEICSWISENCFEYLDAPVMKLGSLDTAVPFHPELESQFLAWDRLEDKLTKLIDY